MSEQVPPVVGVVGLGAMGLPMAVNLVRAGFTTVVWNRSRSACDQAAAAGAQVAESLRQLGERCAVVLTVLPDAPQVHEVLGAGLGDGLATGALLVVMGTVAPAAMADIAAELAPRGVRVVDAPVSGGDVGAIAGTLSIMVGGEESDVGELTAIFAALGTTITHLGPLGSGQVAKACNQIVVAATLAAVGEALTLARHGGLDSQLLLDVLAGGLAASRVLEVKSEKWVSRDFTPGGRADFQLKDLRIALAAGRGLRTALPLTATVEQLFAAMCWMGHENQDHSGVITVIEQLSGHQVALDSPD